MQFQPLSENEIDNLGVSRLEPGLADFEVVNASEKVSKTGNAMIELQLRVWDNKGKEGSIYDYLVSTDKAMWKIYLFCKSINAKEEYEKGNITPDFTIGKTGHCVLKLEKSKDEQYKDRIKINEYLSTEDALKMKEQVKSIQEDGSFDEDLPF